MSATNEFPFIWYLKNGYSAPHGLRVFGTFLCGGGSTMGYKLAGFTHLGGVEIDPEMAAVYRANHNPQYLFTEDIRKFRQRPDLPAEIFDIDILDGSPPCSTFSLSGARESSWGKEKKFREGQAAQRLDDLFFEFIALADRIRPKVIIAENVKGLMLGNAQAYVRKIVDQLNGIGYDVQIYLLNAATMGVPQTRERVFFLCRRRDLGLPPLKLRFREPPIVFGDMEAALPLNDLTGTEPTGTDKRFWAKTRPGRGYDDVANGSFFNHRKAARNRVFNTISANTQVLTHHSEMRKVSWPELAACSTFPLDYDYQTDSRNKKGYIMGMSVPPVMLAQIAQQVKKQWFDLRPA